MNNPIRNSYNNIPLFQSPLNELLDSSYININICTAVMQGNQQPFQVKTISADSFPESARIQAREDRKTYL
jgi:hypothetical protein